MIEYLYKHNNMKHYKNLFISKNKIKSNGQTANSNFPLPFAYLYSEALIMLLWILSSAMFGFV